MLQNILLERKIYASEEHSMMRSMIQDFITNEVESQIEQWEKDGMVSREIWQRAGELGLLCMDMPEEYGGAGLDFTFNALMIEEFARKNISGPGFSLHSDIIAPYILKWGNEAQKKKYLPIMATGKIITAIGMTEPNCGSDLQAIRTTAVDKGDHYLVNGQKTFITNGYMCDMAVVAVKTNPGTAEEGVSLLIMESKWEGFEKGIPFKKIGMKAQDTCELFFDNVKVPKENLLGKEGQGFKIMMTELARERMSVAISAIGGAQGAIEDTLSYTSTRTAFKQPIAGFQNTQFKMAECATELQLHQAFVDRCIEDLAQHKLSAESASMAKYSATDMHGKVVDECLQLFGGYGYMWEYPIARMYADNRVARIYAGTNEIMKLLIARGLYKELFQKLKAMKKNHK
ncbi:MULTISPECIES: acyl-CoA dehydrogenase family protein [unclassified Tenacibaculum]|uniref:acyl-CoA dehydrogenase family protein n=1 Tax=unclassified Tenacibaculum TaxID=2635139 RepID=UPI001F1918CF|nr:MULTISPECIES: acyl-CoA dehydrogenase family protein [unclassified Tenacibaculum]MCF2876460.1 acyl-CoA dehydrogenase family protein [Tenacibaculum sp. Cn5-1]MCF2936633.1 acyl-CoA dehydrogenase family protein [Tenacibaculum sp. Cn5-34]MCG7511774.1 acyl-CoA dehydrogenase family protein [Tenacibaculum sp. Cn5-46]